MIPRIKRYITQTRHRFNQILKMKVCMSFYCIIYLHNFAKNICTICLDLQINVLSFKFWHSRVYKSYCSFVLPSDLRASLLWMLSTLLMSCFVRWSIWRKKYFKNHLWGGCEGGNIISTSQSEKRHIFNKLSN